MAQEQSLRHGLDILLIYVALIYICPIDELVPVI